MSRKNKVMLAVMLALGVAIFAYSVRNVSWHLIAGDIAHLKWGWLAVAVGCMVLSLFLESLVVHTLVRNRVAAHFPLRDAIRIPLVEQLFNGITPFATGGQPAQVFALLQSGVEGGQATSLLLLKFVVYQTMIVVNFLICLVAGFHYIADKIHVMAVLVIFGFLIHFAVIGGLLMVMYWYNFTRKAVHWCLLPLKWIVSAERFSCIQEYLILKIDNFYQESLQLKAQGKLLVKINLLTLFQLAVYYVIPYFILLALGVSNVSLITVMTMHVLIVIATSLFPIPGGAGGAEFSFTLVFSTFMASHTKLILAMILWRLITYYLGMFAGMIALVVKPRRITVPED